MNLKFQFTAFGSPANRSNIWKTMSFKISFWKALIFKIIITDRKISDNYEKVTQWVAIYIFYVNITYTEFLSLHLISLFIV